jgi:heme-degrading monooxygenase HmoA
MKLSITYIELKSPLKFFSLSWMAMHIMLQLRKTNCKGFKKTGIWTSHYTMSLWETEADMNAFFRSGAHLDAMRNSAKIASFIKVLTIDADNFITWADAKKQLEAVKPITYP